MSQGLIPKSEMGQTGFQVLGWSGRLAHDGLAMARTFEVVEEKGKPVQEA